MYLKLAMRNARRSVMDYLLYIAATVILLSIIFVSNYISVWGNIRANFQTASLPLLIVLIMTFLMAYISNFMVKAAVKGICNLSAVGNEENDAFLPVCLRNRINRDCMFCCRWIVQPVPIQSLLFFFPGE